MLSKNQIGLAMIEKTQVPSNTASRHNRAVAHNRLTLLAAMTCGQRGGLVGAWGEALMRGCESAVTSSFSLALRLSMSNLIDRRSNRAEEQERHPITHGHEEERTLRRMPLLGIGECRSGSLLV